MRELFRVATDRATLVWREYGDAPSPVAVPGTQSSGVLGVVARRGQPVTIRIGEREVLPGAPFHLFEQHDYAISAWTDGARPIRIAHRDPNVTSAFSHGPPSNTTGRVNFGGQIGRSEFTVLVDDEPELDVLVDVFPTKLDYAVDYEHLVADVQSVLTGLVLEYLRATYQLGRRFPAPRPTELEWVLLLGRVVGDLERALRFIAARPVHGLSRQRRQLPAVRVRRVDASLRSAIRRGRGSGPTTPLAGGLAVRAIVEQRAARPTLDTPEHRWLAEQLRACQRRLGAVLRDTLARPPTRRRLQAIAELEQLQRRLVALGALEMFRGVTTLPPPGFASLQLLGAPGYAEAYRCCAVLRLGLRIEGGPFQLALKDISHLYEYWCYLTVLQIVADETGAPLTPRELVKIDALGIQIELAHGRTTRVPFRPAGGGDREIVVTYNPRFAGRDMLIAQEPDILITLRERDWPAMHLVLDAKYRVDASEAYLRANDVPGPPQDAINVLHRYRDAIVDQSRAGQGGAQSDAQGDAQGDAGAGHDQRPRRSVIEAIALFPGTTDPAVFRASRLWRAIERVGIGAIPLLPDHRELLREWLRGALRRGGWALSDRAPRYAAIERARAWQHDAALPLLIGTLRGDDPAGHLAWIGKAQRYYLPKVDDQPRQLRVAKLAIYSPAELTDGRPGAIEYVADVLDCDVVPRRDIPTPWTASDPDQVQVVYKLGPLERRARPIVNLTAGRGERVSSHRWSSVLALGRAGELRELLLETEPEWRLYEAVRVRGAVVELEPDRPRRVDPEDPVGRTWLVVGERRARWAGKSGYELHAPGRPPTHFHQAAEACDFLVAAPITPAQ